MAFRYLIYRTDYNDTIIRASLISGTTGVNEGELYSNFPIPEIQPLYYWRIDTDFSQVQPNSEFWISEWENFISPPTPRDFATLGELTGITTQIQDDVDYISGVTNNKLDESAFNIYSGTTIPNTYETISNFVSYTGVTKTSIDAKLNKTIFDIYTGTTVPNTYLSIGNFNAYSGATNTKINTKASLSGATFTGVIYAPTAILSSNTTQVATTAFVVGQAATAQPLMNGTSAIGTSHQYARQDHVHPKDTGKYDVSGGTISGSVTINDNLNVSGTSTLNTVNAVGTSTLNTLIINSGLAKYAADYSGTYDTRTLVDKNYVDTHPITYLNAVVAGAITTTSATDTLMTGMVITNVPAGTYLLSFGTTLSHSAGGALIYTSIYVGGTQQTASGMSWTRPNQAVMTTHNYSNFVITLATTQSVEIRWRTTTATATATNRYLTLLKASSLT